MQLYTTIQVAPVILSTIEHEQVDQSSGRNPWKKDASTVIFADAKH